MMDFFDQVTDHAHIFAIYFDPNLQHVPYSNFSCFLFMTVVQGLWNWSGLLEINNVFCKLSSFHVRESLGRVIIITKQ